ncbi:hypothetical protein M758_2G073400 [Ceratodon purpureus]|nr:hypothetical protein M758_2G073400 [Ceratodon purpureus]
MALRNHLLLGNRIAAPACGDCSSSLPGNPSGSRAQRLAIRRSVLLRGVSARANLDSTSSATDLLTETTSGGVKLENRLQAAEIALSQSGNVQVKTAKSKKAILFRPELAEVTAALLRGEGVEMTLAPWIGKFTPEEWNKVLAQAGDVHWELALRVFDFLKEKSVFAEQSVPLSNEDDKERELKLLKVYTAVGGVLARNGRQAEIEALISEMRSLGLVPDSHFFNSLIRGYGNKGLIHLASQVLFEMDRLGVKPDVATYERVIAAYLTGEKPQVEKAMRLLQGVRASKIMVGYKTLSDLMTACWNANKLEDADLLFQDMRTANYKIDPKVWLKLMQLHARGGRSEAVEDLFQQMREAGVETKGGAFDALLLSYCRAGKIDQALSVFREYKLNMKPSLVAFNMIIDACGKAGRDEEAVQSYVDLIECRYRPNAVTYTSLISAVAEAGRYEKADELYRRMLQDRVEPTGHTYSTMIHACARRGWTRYGHEICLAASQGPITRAVYGAMLHLYIKGRWYSHAAPVLEEMGRKGIEPDAAGYGTLISACGERDDKVFAPLARAIENSPFEPCQIAHRLVFGASSNDTISSDVSASPIDETSENSETSETASLSTLEADSAVREASAFFKRYASTENTETNASFYNALIDALWGRRLRLRAKAVLLEAREILESFPRPHYNEEAWSLDLRNLSKGASQIALLHWLEEVADRAAACLVVAPRLILITGGRKDSPTVLKPYSGKGRGVGVVRQMVEEVIKDLGLPFSSTSREFGPAQLQAETEQVVRWVSMYKDRLQLSNTASS